jgi:hypothetical protein
MSARSQPRRLRPLLARLMGRLKPRPASDMRSGVVLDPARVTRLAPLVDATYYTRRLAAAADDPVGHYLTCGATLGLSPNPLFDDAFYRVQLAAPLPPGMTPLEHYLADGAAAGLDPSPLFATIAYLRDNPDVAAAGANPLEHFLRWGAHEGRRPLPDSLPDLEERIARVLRDDPDHVHALCLLAQRRLRQHRLEEAAAALERAEQSHALDTLGRILKGCILQKIGHFDRAAALFGDASPMLRDILANLLYEIDERQICIDRLTSSSQSKLSRFVDAELSDVHSACLRRGSLYHELLPRRKIEPLEPSFVEPPRTLTSQPGELVASPLYLGVVDDCLAVTRCNLVLQDERAIYDLATHSFGNWADLRFVSK